MAQKVLVVDVGGTHLKILATGQQTPRKGASGRKMDSPRLCIQLRMRVRSILAETQLNENPLALPATSPVRIKGRRDHR
jgi:hypothetical protein